MLKVFLTLSTALTVCFVVALVAFGSWIGNVAGAGMLLLLPIVIIVGLAEPLFDFAQFLWRHIRARLPRGELH